MSLLRMIMLLFLLASPAATSFASEEKPLDPPVELSEEDRKVVEMLELLEMMELLNDLDDVAALEENQ
ncbi:MAG TPA: hypothetical protein VJ995_05825 [Geothermobacteraceae bacterium]|nr:hypothetical protein [Geothermobacteraceae bacterium]